MKFSKNDIKHIISILKAKFQNLSAEQLFDLAFQILEGLDCYRERKNESD